MATTDVKDFMKELKFNDDEMWNEIEFHSQIVSKIIIRRVDLGLSQNELAQKCGLKQSAIARFESCASIPRLDTIGKILTALDLELEVLPKNILQNEESVYRAKILIMPNRDMYYKPQRDSFGYCVKATQNILDYAIYC